MSDRGVLRHNSVDKVPEVNETSIDACRRNSGIDQK